jgi:hypothetical protein
MLERMLANFCGSSGRDFTSFRIRAAKGVNRAMRLATYAAAFDFFSGGPPHAFQINLRFGNSACGLLDVPARVRSGNFAC